MNNDQLLVPVSINEKAERTQILFDLAKKISMLQRDLIYLKCAIPFLKLKYSKEIADEVRGLGYFVPELPEDTLFINTDPEPMYIKCLDKITTNSEHKFHELETLINKYNILLISEHEMN